MAQLQLRDIGLTAQTLGRTSLYLPRQMGISQQRSLAPSKLRLRMPCTSSPRSVLRDSDQAPAAPRNGLHRRVPHRRHSRAGVAGTRWRREAMKWRTVRQTRHPARVVCRHQGRLLRKSSAIGCLKVSPTGGAFVGRCGVLPPTVSAPSTANDPVWWALAPCWLAGSNPLPCRPATARVCAVSGVGVTGVFHSNSMQGSFDACRGN